MGMTSGRKYMRPVRSFVRREGRLTPSQARALKDLWPRFGVNYSARVLDLEALFSPRTLGRLTLEIGFGNGEALAELALNHPDRNYLGIEVHRPGVGHLLLLIEKLGLGNLRIFRHDAVEVLQEQLPPASLDEILLFFPDPWPKKRHHKRRIVQPAFVDLLASRMKPDGVFHLATDWEDYALQMLEVMDASELFENIAGKGHYSPRPVARPITKFERRGQRLGHGVWDMLYRRNAR